MATLAIANADCFLVGHEGDFSKVDNRTINSFKYNLIAPVDPIMIINTIIKLLKI